MLTYYGDLPGCETISFEDRYRLIKQAGFDATLIWWEDEDRGGCRTQPEIARRAGLWVENIHAGFQQAGDIWEDTVAGQAGYDYYRMCIGDCGALEIPTAVMHVGRGKDPLPPMGKTGLERYARLIDLAQRLGVCIALENQGAPDKNERAMELLAHFDSPNLGMCYDSGHGNMQRSLGRGVEMLARFGHRLMALHLHDNDTTDDMHLLPFDGTTDWPAQMRAIAETGYRGPTTLEVVNEGYQHLPPEEFLALAYERAVRLEWLR